MLKFGGWKKDEEKYTFPLYLPFPPGLGGKGWKETKDYTSVTIRGRKIAD